MGVQYLRCLRKWMQVEMRLMAKLSPRPLAKPKHSVTPPIRFKDAATGSYTLDLYKFELQRLKIDFLLSE